MHRRLPDVIEGASAMQSSLASRTVSNVIQVTLRWAGGARTHDRRIMRSTASCNMRASCTDSTGNRTNDARDTGIIWWPGPRTGPRLGALLPYSPLLCVTPLWHHATRCPPHLDDAASPCPVLTVHVGRKVGLVSRLWRSRSRPGARASVVRHAGAGRCRVGSGRARRDLRRRGGQ